MSNEPKLPSPEEAYKNLFDGVHTQVFFGKLASYGIQPATEKEAMDLLTLAGQLRHVDGSEKQAAESSRFSGAVDALDSIYTETPAGQAQKSAAADLAIEKAAEELMENPEIYNSVLSLSAAEAAVLAGNE